MRSRPCYLAKRMECAAPRRYREQSSADFQSAVSPIFNRHAFEGLVSGILEARVAIVAAAECNSAKQQITNRRYFAPPSLP